MEQRSLGPLMVPAERQQRLAKLVLRGIFLFAQSQQNLRRRPFSSVRAIMFECTFEALATFASGLRFEQLELIGKRK